MSVLYERRLEVTNTRISVVTNTVASLNARVRELELLRDKVRKAQLSIQKSKQTNHQKRPSL
ncbi:hypothetical protein [Bradyrhizobium sp. dw_411]|uniref:hypothetical protein n=1 Tax=Bradyrhizobium sp. dw_411 TaxID=2720082 RepID=UPI001BCFE2CD|nr:hypothetical protein [Bradyrhizobium sp. dw_411]